MGSFAPRNFEIMDAIAGYRSPLGFDLGEASRFPVCITILGSWLLPRQSTERMSENLSIIAACFGRCSQMDTPGIAVSIGMNGPRFSKGRSGFMSQVSM